MKRSRWLRVGYAFAVLAVVVMAMVGWWQTNRDLRLDDLFFLAIRTFFLGEEITKPPFWLQIARFAAPALTATGVGVLIWQFLKASWDQTWARWAQRHAVVVGTGPEVLRLAGRQGYGEYLRRVYVVGDVDAETAAELVAERVTLLPALSDEQLQGLLNQASKITVVGESDEETARLAARVRQALDRLRGAGAGNLPTPTVLFDSPDLAREWNRPPTVVRGVSRVTQIAVEVLGACPPFPIDSAVPDPMVIGDSELAGEIVRRLAIGYQRDGWNPRVRVVTDEDEDRWVDELTEEFGCEHLAITRAPCLSPKGVAEGAVREALAAWVPPRADRGTEGGMRIYIALRDMRRGVTIAKQLLHRFPLVHVSLVVDHQPSWTAVLQGYDGRAHLVSGAELLGRPAALERSEADFLRTELELDAASWPLDSPTLFGVYRPQDGERAQSVTNRPEQIKAGLDLLLERDEELVDRILCAGGLERVFLEELTTAPQLGPTQLAAMRDVLLTALDAKLEPVDEDPVDRAFWALEFVARLPLIVQRAGWTVRAMTPPTPDQPVIDFTAMQEMAKKVHFSYQKTAKALRNPTKSPLVDEGWGGLTPFEQYGNRAVVANYPVKIAAFGLDWRQVKGRRVKIHRFTADQVEQLAIAEHRRWSHFQRRHGRPDHICCQPWEELEDKTQRLDINNAEIMATILAEHDIEIFDPNAEVGLFRDRSIRLPFLRKKRACRTA